MEEFIPNHVSAYTNTDLLNYKHKYDDLYYNTDKSPISDIVYDILVDEIKKRNIFTLEIGYPVRDEDRKVFLPYWLGSLDKIKTQKELEKWVGKNNSNEYIITPKLDGIAALFINKDNNKKLYTRGNGEIGLDISHLIPYINSPLENNIAIRGELIISKSNFLKYKNYSNSRNMVSGIVNSKLIHKDISDIEFIAHELIYPRNNTTVELDLHHLNSIINTVSYRKINKLKGKTTVLQIENLTEILIEMKKENDYEIDGIVVTPNKFHIREKNCNPKYSFAFKLTENENIISTVVEQVEWNVSKRGLCKPRIKIKPVKLSGVIINYATGFNAKYIERNKIGPGTVVNITRSGDTIPYITEILSSTMAQMPPSYSWNETNTDIFIDDSLLSINTMKVKIIVNFFSVLKIKNISISTVTKLYNNNYDTIFKILKMTKNDFKKISGIKEKLASLLYNEIHNKLIDIHLYKLMAASSIFGIGFGEKKLKLLTDKIPNIMEIYKLESPEELYNKILSINGYSDNSAKKIINKLSWFEEFYNKIKPYVTICVNDNCINDSVNNNVSTYVFSGFRDSVLENKIKKSGGVVCDNINKSISILIVLDVNDITTKVLKAKKMGIPIINREDFEKIINN